MLLDLWHSRKGWAQAVSRMSCQDESNDTPLNAETDQLRWTTLLDCASFCSNGHLPLRLLTPPSTMASRCSSPSSPTPSRASSTSRVSSTGRSSFTSRALSIRALSTRALSIRASSIRATRSDTELATTASDHIGSNSDSDLLTARTLLRTSPARSSTPSRARKL
ncbi:hypothetical protein BD626DRAFT_207501 [Schizophyllum amplum]|uniref:Uncharacterized protein n=1 Tax=Schizophyllum amplum TaxID=97359 RepID=A0A550BZ23_9AGAR|nr:hypothetical protein BD626DRAFT_207501 [Auriculariopsis ampla]